VIGNSSAIFDRINRMNMIIFYLVDLLVQILDFAFNIYLSPKVRVSRTGFPVAKGNSLILLHAL